MRKLLGSLMLALVTMASAPAYALTINPTTGLTDFVFSFGGVGSSATFGGDDTLVITGSSPFSITVHVEDCCVDGDSFALVVDGAVRAWDVLEANGGDGAPNGAAAMGPGATYWEALANLTFSAGLHTIDLTQLTGIAGGTYINVSSATARVPEPGTLATVGLGLFALAGLRRRKQ